MNTEKEIKWYSLENKNLPYLLLGIVVLLWLLNLTAIFIDVGHRGIFGDMFGAVNALFSGLAFAGIIYSIRLQQQELKAQQRIMDLQKKEFEIQSAEFKNQTEILRIQQFENTFMTLLKSHHDFVATLSHKSWEGVYVEGVYIFDHINAQIRNKFSEFNGDRQAFYEKEFFAKIRSIPVYLNSLNTLLKYIDRSHLPSDSKSFYYSISNSQTSLNEMSFISNHIFYFKCEEKIEEENILRLKRFVGDIP